MMDLDEKAIQGLYEYILETKRNKTSSIKKVTVVPYRRHCTSWWPEHYSMLPIIYMYSSGKLKFKKDASNKNLILSEGVVRFFRTKREAEAYEALVS